MSFAKQNEIMTLSKEPSNFSFARKSSVGSGK